jgi:hypothetical protein
MKLVAVHDVRVPRGRLVGVTGPAAIKRVGLVFARGERGAECGVDGGVLNVVLRQSGRVFSMSGAVAALLQFSGLNFSSSLFPPDYIKFNLIVNIRVI